RLPPRVARLRGSTPPLRQLDGNDPGRVGEPALPGSSRGSVVELDRRVVDDRGVDAVDVLRRQHRQHDTDDGGDVVAAQLNRYALMLLSLRTLMPSLPTLSAWDSGATAIMPAAVPATTAAFFSTSMAPSRKVSGIFTCDRMNPFR
ncbi:hypothetical protein LH612_30740, partial [Klebsiella pneumoniae]|nr:hypothetical protein [Klebsiella pneumoniae]